MNKRLKTPISWSRVDVVKAISHMEKEGTSIIANLNDVNDDSHKLNLVSNQIANSIYTACKRNYKPNKKQSITNSCHEHCSSANFKAIAEINF